MNETQLLSPVQLKKLRSTKKFEDWCRYYYDPSNKTTYGNKTQAAISAYKLNPIVQYGVAASMGYQNFKKLHFLAQNVGGIFLEKLGYGINELMQLGVEKVKTGSYKDWESFMLLLGIFDSKPQNTDNLQLNQVNINVADEIRRCSIERGLEP